jgi:hypothetical protein
VLGPGTGLGVAALVPVVAAGVLASEGGHASFDPQTLDELESSRRSCGMAASARNGLSGLACRGCCACRSAIGVSTPEAVVANALAGEPAALVTVQLFVQLGPPPADWRSPSSCQRVSRAASPPDSESSLTRRRFRVRRASAHQSLLASIPYG